MEYLNEYVVAMVVAICLCVGYILKNVVPGDRVNRFIPLIMAALGVTLNVWINGFAFDPAILLGGLVSGLASTGAHEALSNFIKRGD